MVQKLKVSFVKESKYNIILFFIEKHTQQLLINLIETSIILTFKQFDNLILGFLISFTIITKFLKTLVLKNNARVNRN